jgi:hypothetical protein
MANAIKMSRAMHSLHQKVDLSEKGDSSSGKPMERGDMKLVASKVGRLHLGKTKLSACNSTQAETVSHVECECEDSAELRPRRSGKHFMDHDKILLRKTLHLVEGTELLAECKNVETHNTSEFGRSARVVLRAQSTHTHILKRESRPDRPVTNRFSSVKVPSTSQP